MAPQDGSEERKKDQVTLQKRTKLQYKHNTSRIQVQYKIESEKD